MRLEEADQSREQGRLARSLAKLIRPNSGQVEEAPRPPFVGER